MEPILRVLGIILILLDYLTRPIFWLLSRKPTERLPALNEPLLLTSATKLAELIRSKKVTSQHVVEVFIARVKAVNPLLNAVVENRFSTAVEEAKKVDELLSTITDEMVLKKLEKEKPFLGVPVTVKESCSLKGMSLCGGSLPRAHVRATRDGVAVEAFKESGAIPLLISTTPELCLGWETNNLVTGITRNPYNLHRTPGGSSGGEAALITGGASVFGISSDVAGSIRVPAMFCGIFGHKPSPGIVSVDGHFPSSTDENFGKVLTIGPLTRYAEDLEPMLFALAGKNSSHGIDRDEIIDLKDLKVTYMLDAGNSLALPSTEESIRAAILNATRYLKRELDADVQASNFEELLDSVEMSISIFLSMTDIPNLLQDENDPKLSKNLYFELLKSLLGAGQYSLGSLGFTFIENTNIFIPKSSTPYYKMRAARLKQKLVETLGTNGVFLYPTFPVPAIQHNQLYTKVTGVLYTMLFNVLGMPATHVPLGLDHNGLPIGMQVIAAPNRDRLCLAVARELERGFGGWVPPFQILKSN